MNINKILCPIDFSSCSETALNYASRLASESDARLLILYVSEGSATYVPGYSEFGYIPEAAVNWEEEERKRLSHVTPSVAGVEFETHYQFGAPSSEILGFAADNDVDLIVMGTHGRRGVTRLLMGSVAEAIVRRAKCPVLTVKEPAGENSDMEQAQAAETEK